MRHFLCILALVTFIGVIGCESDDICDRKVNTPRLVVRFYNAQNHSISLNTSGLTVYGEGTATPVVSNAAIDSLVLPLKIESPTTFVLQSVVSSTVTQTATLTLRYESHHDFVSKACGFNTTFSGLSAELTPATGGWLKGLEIRNTDIKDEKKAHLYLFH
jgi:hypothetical protein